jgi:hypothetical protein
MLKEASSASLLEEAAHHDHRYRFLHVLLCETIHALQIRICESFAHPLLVLTLLAC